VGALTSKPYAFLARPWELKTIETIDLFDSVGSGITFQVRDHFVLRSLPRINPSINMEWMTDRSRFFIDSFRKQRILNTFIKVQGIFVKVKVKFVYRFFSYLFNMKGLQSKMTVLIGSFIDAATLSFLKDLAGCYKHLSVLVGYEENRICDDFNGNYVLAPGFSQLSMFNLFILVASNPRFEAPILNLRLRLLMQKTDIYILSFGIVYYMTYMVYNVGSSIFDLIAFLAGKVPHSNILVKYPKVLILVGMHFFQRVDYKYLLRLVQQFVYVSSMFIAQTVRLMYLSTKAVSISSYDLGYCGMFDTRDKFFVKE